MHRDGKSAETGLLQAWPEGGPKLLWSTGGIGDGYSSIAVAGGRAYTTGMEDNQDVVYAFNVEDGTLAWKTVVGPGWRRSFPASRGTPTVAGDRVYVITGQGRVACLEAGTGDRRWYVDLEESAGIRRYPNWGIAESPLVLGDKVIATPGGEKAVMVALDAGSGRTVWATEGIGDKHAYCSPMAVEQGGRTVIVTQLGDSAIGVDAATGKLLWRDMFAPWQEDAKDINPPTPLAKEGTVYVTNGYDDGGTLLALTADGSGFERRWIDTVLDVHHGGAVEVGGYIYGSNWLSNQDGEWVCVEWGTGEVKWKEKWVNKGAIVYADGRLYCYTEEGEFGLVKPTPEGFELVSSFRVEQGSKQHWAHPAIANGALYVRHGDVLMAYDIRAK